MPMHILHPRRPGRHGHLVSGIGLGAAILLCACPVGGAPVEAKRSRPFQPDGSRYEALSWGDEAYVVAESLDGYTLIRDPKTGFSCYARLSADGAALVSTGIPVGKGPPPGLAQHIRISREAAAAEARSARQLLQDRGAVRRHGAAPALPLGTAGPPAPVPLSPTLGQVRGICVVVDFNDDLGTIPLAAVASHCNDVGYTGFGNNGSVREYFHDVSNGRLTFTHVLPLTYYYRALRLKSYYADPGEPWGDRAKNLLFEALTYIDSKGFDFSQFDANHDTFVDAVTLYYAGDCPNEWAEGLWPGCMSLYWEGDGVRVTQFQMTNMGDELTIGTFSHECGHLLMDWPDLYDYDDDSAGVGAFCLMCNRASNTNPVEPCAYLKALAGWGSLVELAGRRDVSVTAGGDTLYWIRNPALGREYYMVENRQKTGRDQHIPDSGLAIWQIDTMGNNDYQQRTPETHYKVTLVQADGNWDLENDRNQGDATDLFAAPAYTRCTPNTNPNTHWWSGDASPFIIEAISASGSTMTFRFDCAPDTWVDVNSFAWPPMGDFAHPHATFNNGVITVESGGNLWIKAGSVPIGTTSMPIKRPMTLYGYGGSVVIGD